MIKQSALSDLATSLWSKVRCSSLFVVVSVLFWLELLFTVVPLYIILMVTHWMEDHLQLFFSWPYFPRKSGLHNVRPPARPSVRPHIRACIFADTASGGSRVLVPKRPRWCDSEDVAKGAVHEQRSILIPRRQGDGLRPALLWSRLSYWNRSALRQRLACNIYYFYFSWLDFFLN